MTINGDIPTSYTVRCDLHQSIDSIVAVVVIETCRRVSRSTESSIQPEPSTRKPIYLGLDADPSGVTSTPKLLPKKKKKLRSERPRSRKIETNAKQKHENNPFPPHHLFT